ncbi:MAG: hypothetical protein Q9201_002934 [Fulgogasparrea decipioides]
MPRLPTGSDAVSVVDEMPHTLPAQAKAPEVEKVKDATESDEEGGEEEDKNGEESFLVGEKILSHHDNFDDNVIRYEAKSK